MDAATVRDEKRAALARARRAARDLERAGERRDDAIVEAAAVASLSEVARATGLSKPRAGQIVRSARYEQTLALRLGR